MKKRQAYFMLILVLLVGSVLFVLAFVVPPLLEVFEETDTELPPFTKATVATSNFVVNYWILVLFLSALVLTLIWRFLASERGELIVDKWGNVIEPIIIILLGVGIGLLATSLIMPIYNIAGSI